MRRLLLFVSAVFVVALSAVVVSGASSAGSVQARWLIRDLGSLGGNSQANAMNEKGQIVGMSGIGVKSATGGEIAHAFLWQKGRMIDLGTLSADFNVSYASAINGRGQIIGTSEKVVPMGNTEGTERSRAFLWQKGKLTDLGGFGGKITRASAINEEGQIVGYSASTASPYSQAVLWQNGTIADLGTPPGFSGSGASAINERGQVVGSSSTASGEFHAVLWQDGAVTDLGALPGATVSVARDINDRGQVVGYSDTASGEIHAVLWQDGTITDLGTLPGFSGSSASAINARGQVVGYSVTASGEIHAVLWEVRK